MNEKTIAIIRSLDGTWRRPFTTLELAALQSLIDPDEHWSIDPQVQAEIDDSKRSSLAFYLDGNSDSVWREHIVDAAEAIGGVIGTTILLAMTGETFTLSRIPVWVRPFAIAISVAQGEPN